MLPIYVYIAAPYGDHNDADTRLVHTKVAMSVWHKLADLKFIPFCPLLSHFLHEFHPRPRDEWMDHATAWLAKCDCVLAVTPRDEWSPGMREEINLAREWGMPVFQSTVDLARAYGVELEEK